MLGGPGVRTRGDKSSSLRRGRVARLHWQAFQLALHLRSRGVARASLYSLQVGGWRAIRYAQPLYLCLVSLRRLIRVVKIASLSLSYHDADAGRRPSWH